MNNTNIEKDTEKKISLADKIQAKKFNIGILGMGYVGLPLACEFASVGIQTYGFDINSNVITNLNKGVSHIQDIKDSTIASNINKQTIKFTDDFSQLENMDVISICVPTPLRKTKDPDMSYILSAIDFVKKTLTLLVLTLIMKKSNYQLMVKHILSIYQMKKLFHL